MTPLLLCVLALPTFAPAAGPTPPEPVRLIFDTDLGADIDDALALAMIHALESRGACKLLAVTLTNDHPDIGPLTDVINTFYGRGDVPIGRAVNKFPAASRYVETARLKDQGAFRYPRKVRSSAELPPALTVLRRTLAAQPDGSVVIAQVGMSSNLRDLLASGPDSDSPLTGLELARHKVRLVSIMAGAFTPIGDHKRFIEYNVKQDLPATIRLAAEWPTPVVWSGFEIGIAVNYPAASIERDFAYVKHHPVAEAYRLYEKMPYDRPTWDLTSVLYAVYPDRKYFDLSPPGQVTVEKDGFTRFDAAADGKHRYLILKPEQKGRALEALVQLASQPPAPQPAR